jgi:hypothetical protein
MINSCKSSWKDGTRCPMADETPSKSQKQLHFHLFWNAIKNAWYKCVFHFHLHPNASISCIYNYKPLCTRLCEVTSHFYEVPWRTIISKITKMVDLDTSCKNMGWNGHDSLHWEKIIHISCRKTHFDELHKSWLWQIAKKVHYNELKKSIMSCNPEFNPMSHELQRMTTMLFSWMSTNLQWPTTILVLTCNRITLNIQ